MTFIQRVKRKKQKVLFLLATCFCMVLFSAGAQAQKKFDNYEFDSSMTYIIKLKDGTEFIGKVTEKKAGTIVMRTTSVPHVEVPVAEIKTINEVNAANIRKGAYWFPNPHASRYLYGPSAFSLKKGEGYYQNTYLVVNSVNYGVTKNLSVGGGIEFISTFTGHPIFFITPKVTFKVAGKFHAGAGVLVASIPNFSEDNDRSTAGIAYGIATYGTEEHNLTAGLGYGFLQDELAPYPIVTLSGITRVSRKISLVSENWLVPGVDGPLPIFSYGIRFFGEKLAVDLALINNGEIAEIIAIGIPFVSFVVKF
jgi:hypothetical protein